MYQQVFKGNVYSYSYEKETDRFLLYDNNCSSHVVLKEYDVDLFRNQIGWINYKLNDQTEEKKHPFRKGYRFLCIE
jgi:hypothetical protein